MKNLNLKTILILIVFLLLISLPQYTQEAQEAKTAQQEETKKEEIKSLDIPQPRAISYSSQGRRDPFKDLMSGRDIVDPNEPQGINQMQISDIILIGIVKMRGQYSALINDPQGFPYKLKVGDTFSDGYVMAVNESQVIIQKTMERGMKLPRPRKVIKEINTEER